MKRKAFTLVEIMIVIVIIGLLAAMAIPAFQKVKQNSLERRISTGTASRDDWVQYNKLVKDKKAARIKPATMDKVEAEGRSIITIEGKEYILVTRDGKEIAVPIVSQ